MTLRDGFRSSWWARWYTLPERWKAYNLAFRTPSGEVVLADLMTFCGVADEAPREVSEAEQNRAAGRRDVGLRILEHMHLSPEELYAVIQGRSILRKKDFQNANSR